MKPINEQLLADFFAEADTICGAEDTLHALFIHHLIMSGIEHDRVHREYRMNGAPVDITLFDKALERGGKPRVAMEFKGGAYNTRNSLADTIDAMGHCADLTKLRPFANAGVECWFVCVDMAELGVALHGTERHRVAEQCRTHGVRFAYFCQREGRFFVDLGRGLVDRPVSLERTGTQCGVVAFRSDADAPWAKRLASMCAETVGSEDTHIAWLYHALRRTGYGVGQLSLETYFNCASGGSRMQLRPDLAVFDTEVGGRFNLYRNGDPARPNDSHKLAHLQAIVEVKGSAATARFSSARLAKQVAADIDKLGDWRARMSAAHPTSRAGKADYVMLVVGSVARGACDEYASTLRGRADAVGVNLMHFGG